MALKLKKDSNKSISQSKKNCDCNAKYAEDNFIVKLLACGELFVVTDLFYGADNEKK